MMEPLRGIIGKVRYDGDDVQAEAFFSRGRYHRQLYRKYTGRPRLNIPIDNPPLEYDELVVYSYWHSPFSPKPEVIARGATGGLDIPRHQTAERVRNIGYALGAASLMLKDIRGWNYEDVQVYTVDDLAQLSSTISLL